MKSQIISIELYGDIWGRFQKALEAEGCGYWGELYQHIFDDEFVPDQEALTRRMNVPIEIRNQGAAAVAKYYNLNEDDLNKIHENFYKSIY